MNIFWLFTEDTTFYRECEKTAPTGAAMAITLKFVQPSGRDGGNPRDPSLVPEILGGKRDKALAAMAEEFKRTRRPIFVNLGSESNGSLFITPEQSVAAFRYVHDRWRRLGVENVAYVWKPCPGIWRPGVGLVNGNYEDFYPGDDYVDWIASGYYGGDPETARHTGGLKTFYSLSQMARRRGKPFMIAESGPFSGTAGTGGRQTWDSWFRPYFEDIRRSGVRAVVYNNFGVLPDAPKWGEQRIARMERPIQEAWGREMKDPMYLGASPGLFASLGFEGGQAIRTGQVPEQEGPRPAAEPATEVSKGAISVRRVSLSLTETGDCLLSVDTRGEVPPVEPSQGMPATIAGLTTAKVTLEEDGTHRAVYSFGEVGTTADFASLNGNPMSIDGLSIDRAAGALLLTPVLVGKGPVKKSSFSFPRYLKAPVTASIDFEKFDNYTVFLTLKFPEGVLQVRASPRHPGWQQDGSRLGATFTPIVNKRAGKESVMLEGRLEPERLAEYAFHVPAAPSVLGQRCELNVHLQGHEPASIARLDVRGRVTPSFGVSLDADKGVVKVKAVIRGGAAEKAGLKAGDVLVSIDGEKVSDVIGTVNRLSDLTAGKDIPFVLTRAGQEKTIVVRGE